MNRYFAIGVVAAVFISGSAQSASDAEYLKFINSHGKKILDTYRLPDGDDLSYWGTDRDTYFYKTQDSDFENKAPYWTKGQFNNDEQSDYLFIMFHRTENKAYLIGFISSNNGYTSIVIEPSDKFMAVSTNKNLAAHVHLEGHGHWLSWNENEARFDVIQ